MKNLSIQLEASVANESAVGDDGSALFAPYGDAPNVFALKNPAAFRTAFPTAKYYEEDGVVKVDAIQRITATNAKPVADRFSSPVGMVKRWFRGAPVFFRHPDFPGATEMDKRELGRVVKLEAREEGLFGVPVFNDLGAKSVNGREKLFFSPHFDVSPTGVEEGKLIFEPTAFVSVGLTPEPNLAADAVNEAASNAANLSTPPMNKVVLLGALAGLGINLAADASDDAIAASITGLAPRLSTGASAANERDTAKADVARLQAELAALKAASANEAKGVRDAAINAAIQDGRITEAQRATWDGILTASAANGLAALNGLPKTVKTTASAKTVADATAASANAEASAANEAKSGVIGFDRALADLKKQRGTADSTAA